MSRSHIRPSSLPPLLSTTPSGPSARAAKAKSAPPPGGVARNPLPQEVRIIGGQFKRSKLPVAEGPGVRPTPARVRETLFNWLGHNLSGWSVIDAFAGSGALGLEAASRGGTAVVLVERDAALARSLRQTVLRLNAQQLVAVEQGDAMQALQRRAGGTVDLVLLDPPFLDGANDDVVKGALRAALPCLKPSGLVYLEAPRVWAPEELAALGCEATHTDKAGAVHFMLLRPRS